MATLKSGNDKIGIVQKVFSEKASAIARMPQKCVNNASEMRQNGSCFIGKRGTSKMRQKSVNFGRYRQKIRTSKVQEVIRVRSLLSSGPEQLFELHQYVQQIRDREALKCAKPLGDSTGGMAFFAMPVAIALCRKLSVVRPINCSLLFRKVRASNLPKHLPYCVSVPSERGG